MAKETPDYVTAACDDQIAQNIQTQNKNSNSDSIQYKFCNAASQLAHSLNLKTPGWFHEFEEHHVFYLNGELISAEKNLMLALEHAQYACDWLDLRTDCGRQEPDFYMYVTEKTRHFEFND